MHLPNLALSVLVILFLTLLSTSGHAQVNFSPKNVVTDHEAGNGTEVGDIDNDGLQDVVSCNPERGIIAWKKNMGNGLFSDANFISIAARVTYDLHLEDLDNDLDLDLIAADFDDDEVSVFENLGGGVFGEEQIVTVNADGVLDVFAADLDGDGFQDILSASRSGSKIEWYNNLGDGTFSDGILIASEISQAWNVLAADMDGDGDIDVVSTAYQSGEIAWCENLGAGVFDLPQVIEFDASNVTGLEIIDLNNDGDLEIIAAVTGENHIAVYFNLGDGTFSEANTIPTSYVSTGSVSSADLDNDGDNDIIDTGIGQVRWFENLGDGIFSDAQMIDSSLPNASKINFGDLNLDGYLDIIVETHWDQRIIWYENLSEGNFSSGTIISANARNARDVYSQDLDNDGDMDLLSASGGHKIAWYENFGDGVFSTQKIISQLAIEAVAVHAADLNLDGYMDVLSASEGDDKIAWYENLGNGTFTDFQIIHTGTNGAHEVKTADVDQDGDQDVLSASRGGTRIAWYENFGDGSFSEQMIISDNVHSVSTLYPSDLDNDGYLDIVTTSALSHQIIWFKNNGNSTFSDASVISENQAEGPLTVHADDLDNDGDMDVIASSNYDNTISWYRNNGSGSFSDEQVVTTNAGWGEDLYTGDLDGDGDADLIVAMRYGNEVVWYENLGLGFFSEKYLISNIIDGPFAVYCEDLDGDGDLDVISGASNDEIAWYENSGAQGCTDPEAENYNPIASLDNGSCCFGTSGCANPNAVNFNPEAQCDNGSCRFRFEGFVFHDENENGIWDEGMEGEEGEEDIAPEYLLPSQEIRIEPIGLITWTDDSGAFSFEATAGYFNIEVVNSESMPFSTTINPLAYNGSQAPSEIRFGVSQESPVFEVAVDFYSSRSGYPCNDWVNHDFCFRNNGNTPIDGVIELEINPLFQDFMLSEPLDSLVDGFLYLSFDNLLPGQTECRTMDLLTPTVDYIGEVIVSTARVYGYQDEVQIAFGEDVIEVEMTCSYDPNDKQVFPNGYAEPHYILNDTQLEYLIRFQNTGNAPASNVLISDTLDANLNLETFALVAHSHSVQVTLKQDLRVVEFLFENIMLPDSTSNEAESHGLVSFLINPHTELTPGTELNNTGNIFFDNNPPIITNTTWNTIYECTNELADVEPFENMLCPSELFVVENNQDYVETYHWSAEGENISTDSIMNSYFTPGEHSILLEVSNPICEASNTFNIDVLDHPEITITSDTSICSGDSVVIAIESDDNVQWQNLGIGLEHTVSPLETQEYIAVANNEEGCELEETVVITVNENPEMSISEGQVICMGDSVTITVNSEDNVHWQNLDEELEQIVSPTETQEYIAVANTEQGCESEGSVIIAVNPTPTAFAGDDTFICVGGTTMLTGEGGGEYAWTGFDEGPTITVAPVENTSYELLVTNEFNCQDTDAVVVEVIQYPEANVSVNGNDLLSGPASSYQWFLNGEIIEGAQNQDYLVSEDGNYQVQVSNEWGCSSMSEEQFVLFVSVYELSRWGDFKLYPNPASDQVVIESNFQSGLIEVFESNGRKIISEPFNDPISYINVSQLAEGVYQVQLRDKDGFSVSRRMVVFH